MTQPKINQKINSIANFLLAAAIKKIYPTTQIATWGMDETGFYTDFKFASSLVLDELPKIENQMNSFVKSGFEIRTSNKNAINFEWNNFLKEFQEGLSSKVFALFDSSTSKEVFVISYEDLDIANLKNVKKIKLENISGAYWKNDTKNEQLTRIKGVAFDSKEAQDEYQEYVKDLQERDHRKLGKELKIFTFSQLSGQGFPFWLENGLSIKLRIQNFLRTKEREYGFKEVHTPAFGSIELYRRSGHFDHYGTEMYSPVEIDNEKIIMRPMTCPHHILLYEETKHSYRDLPIRTSEHSRLYRYEKSGALTGLERVRSMELTDAHLFVRENQIKEEFTRCYKLIDEVLAKFEIKIDHIALSLRDENDKEKYFNDPKMWNQAEFVLKEALDELKVDYVIEKGEAAFYGPKVDIQVRTVLGHIITMSTLQLDFLLPSKFELTYINEQGIEERPVIIHRGLIGTYERFMAILLEQTKGIFPFWLAPIQVMVIPVEYSKHLEFAKKINDQFIKEGFYSFLDDSQERLGKKIRNAQISKAKFQVIIGDEEITNKKLSLRAYGQKETSNLTFDEIIAKFKLLFQ